jgi:hypothetical protein
MSENTPTCTKTENPRKTIITCEVLKGDAVADTSASDVTGPSDVPDTNPEQKQLAKDALTKNTGSGNTTELGAATDLLNSGNATGLGAAAADLLNSDNAKDLGGAAADLLNSGKVPPELGAAAQSMAGLFSKVGGKPKIKSKKSKIKNKSKKQNQDKTKLNQLKKEMKKLKQKIQKLTRKLR